jgi:hypothetical protein
MGRQNFKGILIMKTNVLLLIASMAILAGCTKVTPTDTTQQPQSGVNTTDSSLNYYARATATFGVSASNGDGSDSSSIKLHLLKTSYASGTCTGHTSCYDFTDITISNTEQTVFALTQSQENITENTNNNSLTNFSTVNIGTLWDNNLFACGGLKCTSAAIRVYTTNEPQSGLYNAGDQQSIPLYIGNANIPPTPIGLSSTNAVVLEVDPLSVSEQVFDLADLTNTAFNFSANMQPAGAGMFETTVVFEYDLASSGGIYTGPSTQLALLSYYNDPLFQIGGGGGDGTYSGPGILLQQAEVVSSPSSVQVASDNSFSILSGFDGAIQ